VVAIAPAGNLATGGNVVVVAGNDPLPVEQLTEIAGEFGLDVDVLTGERLSQYIGDASLLTDDFAPVDQLFDRPGAPPSL
jgi:hypothetical protein